MVSWQGESRLALPLFSALSPASALAGAPIPLAQTMHESLTQPLSPAEPAAAGLPLPVVPPLPSAVEPPAPAANGASNGASNGAAHGAPALAPAAPARAKERAPVIELPPPAVNVTLIRKSLLDEIMASRGMAVDGRARRIVEPIVARSIDRFVQMMAEVDRRTAAYGFFEAARWMLPHFARGVEVIGADLVPTEGPVLFVSNHPGNFDEVVIAANVRRPDLRVFANSHPVLTSFPAISRHAVFSKENDTAARMNALRSGIRNLRQGGALLIFPTGRTDPDPRRIAGASEAIEGWSPSVELIVNRAPETQVVVTLVSGVTSRPILNNPLMRVRRQQLERQKLAGTIQMALQMVFPRLFHLTPRVSFSRPLSLRELTQEGGRSVQQAIIAQAQGLLHLHTPETPVVPPIALSSVG